jgi:hypothetical protein
MVIYDSADIYVSSQTTLRAKIAALDAIIDALITTCLKSAATGNVTEYNLDTGQTKIKTMYRSPKEVSDAITAFETVKNYYVNQLNGGRRLKLVDSKNFLGPYYGTRRF